MKKMEGVQEERGAEGVEGEQGCSLHCTTSPGKTALSSASRKGRRLALCGAI